MKSPRFLLYGIGGVYNYGCEAIVRGTEIILREIWPDAVIRYASLRPEDDARRLKDTRVEIIPRKRYSRYSMRNVCRKFVSMAGGSWTPIMENLDFLDDCDVVLSIGGDLYTMYPSGNYPKRLLKTGEVILRKGKKFIIWGASVGPFNKDVEESFQLHLKKASLITSREIESTDYLKTLGIRSNVVTCADPAYMVYPIEPRVSTLDSRLRIGINLSPLSIYEAMSHQEIELILTAQAKTISELVKKLDASILLVPHVISNFNEQDDDLRYMQKLIRFLPEDVLNKVELYDNNSGFLGARSKIKECHLVISARMHCSINAISAYVPTILVSYSKKSIGMAEYVYGNKKWVIPIQEFGSPMVMNVVKNLLSEYDLVSGHLTGRVPYLRDDARNAGIALVNLLN